MGDNMNTKKNFKNKIKFFEVLFKIFSSDILILFHKVLRLYKMKIFKYKSLLKFNKINSNISLKNYLNFYKIGDAITEQYIKQNIYQLRLQWF